MNNKPEGELRRISPLGERQGPGSFDTFFDTKKHENLEAAINADDLVVIDFVITDKGTKYFEAFHTKNPSHKLYRMLEIQHFPAGIDVYDDAAACEMAQTLFERQNK